MSSIAKLVVLASLAVGILSEPIPLQKRMSYHDNDVSFSLNSDVNKGAFLQNGQFKITGMSITNGQDEDNHNNVGDTKQFASTLSFSVGRKASSEVADFWNGNIDSDRNTFNHNADELNFAFLGELSFTLGGPGVTAVFKDIGIAQGHSGTSNNWWFGGKNCAHDQGKGDFIVTCQGEDSDGNVMVAGFQRGGAARVTLAEVGEIIGYVSDAIPFLPRIPKFIIPREMNYHARSLSEIYAQDTDVDQISITDIEYVRTAGKSDPAGTVLQNDNGSGGQSSDQGSSQGQGSNQNQDSGQGSNQDQSSNQPATQSQNQSPPSQSPTPSPQAPLTVTVTAGVEPASGTEPAVFGTQPAAFGTEPTSGTQNQPQNQNPPSTSSANVHKLVYNTLILPALSVIFVLFI